MQSAPAAYRSRSAKPFSVIAVLKLLGFQRYKRGTYKTVRGGCELIIRSADYRLTASPYRPLQCKTRYLGTGYVYTEQYQDLRQFVEEKIPEMIKRYDELIPPPPQDPPIRGGAFRPKASFPPSLEYREWMIETWKAIIRAVAALPERQV